MLALPSVPEVVEPRTKFGLKTKFTVSDGANPVAEAVYVVLVPS